MSKIALALGGNIGSTEELFQQAVSLLTRNGVENIRLSPIIVTQPVDCPPGTPLFKNAALTATWNGSPQELLQLCQSIEIALGRPKEHGRNQSRTVDIDIITFDKQEINSPDLIIPHPRAAQRRFVLEPLAAIAPEWLIGKKSAARLLAELKD